ncbi:hypothetical protein GCM10009623_35480 [Nocardioides aestuarii]|uniref:Sensor histidine kinase n=1 Tax=Nocardioides aestuarii TaxID=252231 RepID=A0ABW4TUE8_9ACTN
MRRGADSSDQRSGRDDGDLPSVLAPALRRFALYTLAATLILLVCSVWIAGRLAREHALHDATRQAEGLALRIAAPLIDADVRAGVPGSYDELTLVMDNRMRDGSVRHVKVWGEDGRVIWADEPELVGEGFTLPDEVVALFSNPGTSADLSELSRDENATESGEGPLLEVYVGTVDADGEPVVIESYLEAEPMEENARTVLFGFGLVIVGATVLLALVVLPLAVDLCRHVERAQRDRSRLMRHAVLASDLERRRIARTLHDGVVQDLAGVGYTIPVVEEEMRPDGDLELARTTLERLAGLVRGSVQALRTVLTELYPPDLRGEGLRDAIENLVASEATAAGLESEVRVAPGLELPDAPARLAYRVVREALRNVVKHAGASQVRVELGLRDGQARVRVVDDGRGCPAGSVPMRQEEGHLGLPLLADTIRDAGGTFVATSPGPGLGVDVVATFPLVLRGQ